MKDLDKLRSVVTSVIDGKDEDAQINFHDYLRGAMKSVTGIDMAQKDSPTPAAEPDKE